MAITRKPQSKAAPSVDIDALINKGGTIAQAGQGTPDAEQESDTSAFTLRVPKALLRDVDAHLKKKPIKTQRQYWILEAVMEKLERERSSR